LIWVLSIEFWVLSSVLSVFEVANKLCEYVCLNNSYQEEEEPGVSRVSQKMVLLGWETNVFPLRAFPM
jgi:hypothetical protein